MVMPSPDNLDPHTREFLCSGRPVLAGVSGGRDSIALLTLLSRLDGCRLMACHVHHGLRMEADDEAEFVRKYADSLGVPFLLGKADIPAQARLNRESIEASARKARQELFLQWSKNFPGALVALAHHRNDQQETALLHLCRGASGIHGMSPVSAWANGLTVLRPILNFSRQDITDYLANQRISWVDDASNQSTEYTRNALRHEIIPLLDQMFHRDTSIPVARACRIESQIRQALSQALDLMDLTDPQGRLFLPKINRLPEELKQCAVHHYLQTQQVPDLGEAAVLRVMHILDASHTSRTSLPGNKIAVRKEQRLSIMDASPLLNTREQHLEDKAGGI